ncbi:MAG: hypothetical protein R3F60_15640 [bacterium]
MPVQFGLNVHEIVASDGANENSTFCAYYAADEFLLENRPLDDAVLLRLGQGGLDDGEPDRPMQSLADVLRRVINSAGLRDTIHQAALAQNPIVPRECRVRVLGACLFSFSASTPICGSAAATASTSRWSMGASGRASSSATWTSTLAFWARWATGRGSARTRS